MAVHLPIRDIKNYLSQCVIGLEALNYETQQGAGIPFAQVVRLPGEEDDQAVEERLREANLVCVYCQQLARSPLWIDCPNHCQPSCAECLTKDVYVKWSGLHVRGQK